jgi:hypothetical protein
MSTADMRPQLAEDVVDLMARVSFCVAAERDRGFQQRLRSAARVRKDEPLLVPNTPGCSGRDRLDLDADRGRMRAKHRNRDIHVGKQRQ